MIDTRVSSPGLPPVLPDRLLPGAAGRQWRRQGCGASRTSPRGRGLTPGHCQTGPGLGRPRTVRGTDPVAARGAACPPVGRPGHSAAVASTAGQSQVAPTPTARAPTDSRTTRRADPAPVPRKSFVGIHPHPGRATTFGTPGRRRHHPQDTAKPRHPARAEA